MGQHWGGRPATRFRALVFATYGRTCWLCGHGGAGEVDHLKKRSEGGALYDLANARPAHGSMAPCPVCRTPEGRARCCNQERNRKPRPHRAEVVVDLSTV
jgi:hypothetical protein